jgi:hypothetical protein
LATTTLPAATITGSSQIPELDALAMDMAQKIQSATTPVARMMQFVSQLMKDYHQQAAKVHHKGPSMIDRVHHKLDHMLKKGSGSGKTGL